MRIVRASADEHPDLFWAIRGGGGNFGVVTAFELRLHQLADAEGLQHPDQRLDLVHGAVRLDGDGLRAHVDHPGAEELLIALREFLNRAA